MGSSAPKVSTIDYPSADGSGASAGGLISVGGNNINMQNPYMMDPNSLDPYAAKYLQQNADMYKGLQGSILGQDQYKQMQAYDQDRLMSALGNQYAAQGLSGSSAAMGGMSSALQSNQMAWLSRQQSDYAKYLQAGEGLTAQGYGMTQGIQGNYGQFESVYGQDVLGALGLQQQAQASNNQMTGQIIGGGLSGGGAAAALLL